MWLFLLWSVVSVSTYPDVATGSERQSAQLPDIWKRKIGKRKDLSEFDIGQIVIARGVGQSISKTAALVGCSRSVVVSIYQKWSKEGTVVNRRQGHGRPRHIDPCGERRLSEIAQEVNAGSDRKVSEYTVHRSLCMGLHSRRPDPS
ncbi:hypothetical protein DPX16_21180 [Anabarilius grahami]|uniref:Uncharacterized protein n=1 Tax=Anabarilius grahami TaxID=495550 RepID=A0A3N0Z3K2_ANAGA|nr:hypothetical protein DPX16_21180 [Anabarilius grahami]